MSEGAMSLSVLDATGRIISNSITHTVSDLDVLEVQFEPKLSPGMYFLQLKSKEGISNRKWIVK
jgi:hypothetical protein